MMPIEILAASSSKLRPMPDLDLSTSEPKKRTADQSYLDHSVAAGGVNGGAAAKPQLPDPGVPLSPELRQSVGKFINDQLPQPGQDVDQLPLILPFIATHLPQIEALLQQQHPEFKNITAEQVAQVKAYFVSQLGEADAGSTPADSPKPGIIAINTKSPMQDLLLLIMTYFAKAMISNAKMEGSLMVLANTVAQHAAQSRFEASVTNAAIGITTGLFSMASTAYSARTGIAGVKDQFAGENMKNLPVLQQTKEQFEQTQQLLQARVAQVDQQLNEAQATLRQLESEHYATKQEVVAAKQAVDEAEQQLKTLQDELQTRELQYLTSLPDKTEALQALAVRKKEAEQDIQALDEKLAAENTPEWLTEWETKRSEWDEAKRSMIAERAEKRDELDMIADVSQDLEAQQLFFSQLKDPSLDWQQKSELTQQRLAAIEQQKTSLSEDMANRAEAPAWKQSQMKGRFEGLASLQQEVQGSSDFYYGVETALKTQEERLGLATDQYIAAIKQARQQQYQVIVDLRSEHDSLMPQLEEKGQALDKAGHALEEHAEMKKAQEKLDKARDKQQQAEQKCGEAQKSYEAAKSKWQLTKDVKDAETLKKLEKVQASAQKKLDAAKAELTQSEQYIEAITTNTDIAKQKIHDASLKVQKGQMHSQLTQSFTAMANTTGATAADAKKQVAEEQAANAETQRTALALFGKFSDTFTTTLQQLMKIFIEAANQMANMLGNFMHA